MNMTKSAIWQNIVPLNPTCDTDPQVVKSNLRGLLMKIILISSFLLIFALTFANAQATKSMNWEDSTRDVYIDGQIDRDALVLYPDSGKKMALFSSKLRQAIVLDTADGTVGVMEKDAFKFSA